MIEESISYFEQLQKDYLRLLERVEDDKLGSELSINKVLSFIDDIKFYWLKRLDLIRYHLDILTKHKMCFLLCGAIYLDTKNNGHYLFKTLGDHHILFDPFLKLEPIFRANINTPNQSENLEYFDKVLTDTKTILTNFATSFFILPIHDIIQEKKREHQSVLNKFYWMFISGVFQKDFSNQEEFMANYKSFDIIEADINDYVKDNLIFLDIADTELPLLERINNYCENQSNLHNLVKGKSDVQKFIISLHNYIYQIMDIILICISLNMTPFIRFEVTFRYLSLVMHTFKDDKLLKEMIERTIIFYILYHIIDREKIFSIEFSEYCNKLSDKNLLNNIIERKEKNSIDFIEDGIKEIKAIIIDEINKLFV